MGSSAPPGRRKAVNRQSANCAAMATQLPIRADINIWTDAVSSPRLGVFNIRYLTRIERRLPGSDPAGAGLQHRGQPRPRLRAPRGHLPRTAHPQRPAPLPVTSPLTSRSRAAPCPAVPPPLPCGAHAAAARRCVRGRPRRAQPTAPLPEHPRAPAPLPPNPAVPGEGCAARPGEPLRLPVRCAHGVPGTHRTAPAPGARPLPAHSGICTRTVQHQDSQVNALEITPDRSMIAAAGYQHIRMYDLNSNNPNPVINYDGVSKNITSVGFHEDGRWMYTGGEDCMARIWDLRSRNLQCQRIFQVNAPINCVCLHPNQAELIVGDQSGAIHIWDLKTDHNEQLIPEPEVSVNSVHIDPDASYMAAVNSSGNCYVWNLTGGIGEEVTQLIPKTKIPAHNRYALQCKFSPDSTLLATCSADQTCKIWRTSNFSLMTELSIKSNNPGETSRGWMWDCAFSGDSQYIVTASSDNLARLWCVETGEIKREYSGHQKAVVCLAFNDSVLG
uniref:Target of rapamycin complex subunit lst8 n=1 Tax=Phasianus colchicus TaxID=9054 RepID=A0A669QUA8_PHACC